MTDQRLPIVDGDDGQWGEILNQFLEKEHHNTGSNNAENGMHKGITIRPGTTSVAPISFTLSGADTLTTPVAGTLEVNSSGVLYYTQSSGSGNRRRVMYYDHSVAATGDIFYRDSSTRIISLGIGSTGDVLTVAGGLPSWAAPSGGGGNEYADDVFRIKDNGDNTKKLAFEVSAITTATTRTLTVPDYDATIATLAGTETLSGKTLTTPKIADAGSINDGNGNEYLKFAQTASAVNELTITNAAATTAPQLSATGGDTNIDLKLAGKGTGTIAPQSHVSATSKNIYFTEYDNGNSGTSKTIDWSANGHKQKITMTGDCAFTFTAPAGPCNLLLKKIQDGTGGRVPTWPAAVKWPGGTKPVHSGASKTDIVTFYYDGTDYYGVANMDFA